MTFAAEVEAFLRDTPRPAGLVDFGATPRPEDVAPGRAWQEALSGKRFACLHWPADRGGRDAPVADQAAFAEACAEAGVPRQLSLVGPDLVGPVLMRFGTAAQQDAYLEPIRTGAHLWTQLFSEPGAGSDLASVRTRAVRDGDAWVVDGQKVWSSGAASADLGLLLARTGGPGHGGLSVFVVPMDAAGITVRPIHQIDGEAKFNEVFLDGVRLAPDALVGAEGEGWTVATATLGRERLSLGSNAVGMFAWLRDIETTAAAGGLLDEQLRDRIVEQWLQVWLLRATWERAVDEGAEPGTASYSVLKLLTSETSRAIGDLGVDALGRAALSSDEPLVTRMLTSHAQTILGGTSEIQRNVLAERVLGLPRR